MDTGQRSLFDEPEPEPAIPGAQVPCRFDGPEYVRERDQKRLTGQISRIFEAIKDGEWRTLRAISRLTGDPTPSVSAQLRHMRKERFGSHTVNRRHVEGGLFEYQLIPNSASEGDEP